MRGCRDRVKSWRPWGPSVSVGVVQAAGRGRVASGASAPRDAGGFALLEVMACVAVLVVAITVFLAAIAQNIRLEEMNSETNIALNTANRVVETTRSLAYGEVAYGAVPQTFEASGLGNDGHTITLMNSAGSTQVGQVTITENPAGTCKTVHIRVLWRSITGSDREMALMTEMTDY